MKRTLRAALALIALAPAWSVHGQPPPQPGPLEVCADPNNMPFSNRAGEGFENRLAEIWARSLGRTLEYTWFPHRRGFERHTLNAADPVTGEPLCDVIMGVPLGYDLAMTTRPYYRSTYALVYLAGGKLDVKTGDELVGLAPEQREALRIGVFTPGPAADWLAFHGMHRQMVAYPVLLADPGAYPGQVIERELLEERIDAAILWGPIAGYFAARVEPREAVVVPLRSEVGVQFDFPIAAGVRFGDRESRALLENVMARTASEASALLEEYHVPAAAAPDELVYVTSEDGATISVISTLSQRVVREAEAEAEAGAEGAEVGAAREQRGTAEQGAGEQDAAAQRNARPPDSISSRDGARAYVSTERGDGISVVDPGTGDVIETIVLPSGSSPTGLVLSPDERRLYVSNGRAGTVTVIDLERSEVLADIRVGTDPKAIAMTSDGKFLYTANESSNDVSVIDTESLNVVATIRVGASPSGVAVGPAAVAAAD